MTIRAHKQDIATEPWIVLGDSIAKGIVFDSGERKLKRIKASFAALFAEHYKLDIKNYAIFGANIEKGHKQLVRHAHNFTGGYALLSFGGNDCDFFWSEISERPYEKHLPQVPLEQYVAKYLDLIQKLRSLGYKPVVLNLPPIKHYIYFQTISAGLRSEAILEWLGGHTDYMYRWQESYSIAVGELAHDAGVDFIDIRSSFLRERDYAPYICADGTHPTELGHRLIFERIKAYFD